MKTLNDFKQQVAIKYGHESFEQMKLTRLNSDVYLKLDEAKELYSTYKQGWNEALHWAADHPNRKFIGSFTVVIDKDDILKGLKKENE